MNWPLFWLISVLVVLAIIVIGFAFALIRGMKPPADATRVIHWRDR